MCPTAGSRSCPWTRAVTRYRAHRMNWSAGKGVGFEAAVDASRGRLWPREPLGEGASPGCYDRQRRSVERTGRLLGLSAEVASRAAEQITEHLGIDGLTHQQARQEFIESPGLHQRGQAIVSILQVFSNSDELCVRLLAAGSRCGLWGTVWLWDPSINRRVSPASRLARTRAPP
jgi:hypothetical protein